MAIYPDPYATVLSLRAALAAWQSKGRKHGQSGRPLLLDNRCTPDTTSAKDR